MAEYFLAPSLVTFRASINRAFPNRDKSSDGWIGDASHAARPSEHNPCWTCTGFQRGIVRAIDVDVDDNDAGRDLRKMILDSAIGHRAVWYVISNGIIYSRTYDWKARRYTGTNGHFHHVHVSINKTLSAAKDTTLVLKGATVPTDPKPPEDDEMTPAQMKELKDHVTTETQRFAVANNNYTRQVLSTATKAILTEIDEVDEETAETVAARLDAQFKKLSDEILADGGA